MSNEFAGIITLPGYDVSTASPEQCSIHSDYPSPKLEERNVDVLTYTFVSNPAIGSTTNLLTVNHGYSYVPAAVVYVKDVTAGRFSILPYNVVFPTQYMITYTTNTQLKVDYKCPIDNSTDMTGRIFQFKYYIFVEEGR